MPNPSRRRPSARSAAAEAARPLPPLWAGLVALAVIAVVVASGTVIALAQRPELKGPFASCRTQTELAPGQYTGPPAMCIDTSKGYRADVTTTKGTFTLHLMPKKAPKTVNNFVVLALHGYFDGQRFFDARDWVVRSGDPTDTGRGGPGYTLPAAEPIAGDDWTAGSVGMARLPDGGISGSQFFVTRTGWQGGNPSVSYNHFATVSSGFDIVGQLSGSDRVLRVKVRQA
jgi:cyclophilin family peptidyl-prolyl cis-trans isomerase